MYKNIRKKNFRNDLQSLILYKSLLSISSLARFWSTVYYKTGKLYYLYL